MSYSWPGNIRELRNTVESCVVLARGKVIDIDDLPPQITECGSAGSVDIRIGTSLDEAEKMLIMSTIDYCRGNKTRAAEILKIGRKTLHRKLEEYSSPAESGT